MWTIESRGRLMSPDLRVVSRNVSYSGVEGGGHSVFKVYKRFV